jgi:hypothetical protein
MTTRRSASRYGSGFSQIACGQAEDRRRSPDADGEREHGHRREAGCPPEATAGVPQINPRAAKTLQRSGRARHARMLPREGHAECMACHHIQRRAAHARRGRDLARFVLEIVEERIGLSRRREQAKAAIARRMAWRMPVTSRSPAAIPPSFV